VSIKEGNDVHDKPALPERQNLKAPDVQEARNSSGELIKATEATRTTASDGSLRDRAKLTAEQDDSIQIMGMAGIAASRTNRLSEKDLTVKDPAAKSIDVRELLAKPEKEAQALVEEFGRVTNMPAGQARDADLIKVQQLADKTYGRGQYAENGQPGISADTTAVRSDQDRITLKPFEVTPSFIKTGLDYNDEKIPLSQKLADFAKSAQARLLDPTGRQAYFQGMIDETLGVGEGLNLAKEEIKDASKMAAIKAWTALNDGSVATFMATPNAINEPLFKTIGGCLDAMKRDPNTVNNVLTVIGRELEEASNKYGKMTPYDRGVQDGKAMFFFINPSGTTEAGDLAMKIVDQTIAPIDKALNEAVQASVKAAQDLAKTSAESALETKQMLLDYLQSKGITGPRVKLAGVPDGFFDGMRPTESLKASDTVNAMSATGDSGAYKPSDAFRGDHDPYGLLNEKGRLKSSLNEAGDLVPPDPAGLYKGREVTIVEHVNGGWSKAAKAHSPYTSFGHDGVVGKYGGKEIKVDLDKLRSAIAGNDLQGVQVVEHGEIIEAIQNDLKLPKGVKTKLTNWVTADQEVLVKGVIPSQFIQIGAN
jgi:hypothetical protein